MVCEISDANRSGKERTLAHELEPQKNKGGFLARPYASKCCLLNQRPWLMPEGKPCSQPFWLFHGRSEAFSGSVVLQPVLSPTRAAATKMSQSAFILCK